MKKMSAKLSFLLVALMAAVAIGIVGCGQNDGSSSVDGIISGDTDDVMSGKTPVVSIAKTVTTSMNKTEISYHISSDVEVSTDLVIGLEIRVGDNNTEGAILVMREGTNISEAFSFGDDIQQVTLMEHAGLLSFKSTVAAINTEELSVDFTEYPLHQRRYILSGDRQVSR